MSVVEHDVSGNSFQDGVTNFNFRSMEKAMSLAGISDEDSQQALVEMSESLFRRCRKWNLIDQRTTTQFPSGKKNIQNFIQGTQVVIDPLLADGPVQRVRIYDKNDKLVGLLRVREY